MRTERETWSHYVPFMYSQETQYKKDVVTIKANYAVDKGLKIGHMTRPDYFHLEHKRKDNTIRLVFHASDKITQAHKFCPNTNMTRPKKRPFFQPLIYMKLSQPFWPFLATSKVSDLIQKRRESAFSVSMEAVEAVSPSK